MENENVEVRVSKQKIRLTVEQWAEIESRYLIGDNISRVARDYKISWDTIYSKAKRDKWEKHGSRKEMVKERIKTEVEDEIIDDYRKAIKKANTEHLGLIKSAKIMVERGDEKVWDILEAVIKNHPVLLIFLIPFLFPLYQSMP